MIYFYLFIPLFALFYFTLGSFVRPETRMSLVLVSFVCTSITLYIYQELEGQNNYKLIHDKENSRKICCDQSLSENKTLIDVRRIILETI